MEKVKIPDQELAIIKMFVDKIAANPADIIASLSGVERSTFDTNSDIMSLGLEDGEKVSCSLFSYYVTCYVKTTFDKEKAAVILITANMLFKIARDKLTPLDDNPDKQTEEWLDYIDKIVDNDDLVPLIDLGSIDKYG